MLSFFSLPSPHDWHSTSGRKQFLHATHEDGRTTLRFAFCGTVGDHAPEQPLDEGIVAAHWLSASDLAARENLRSPLVLRAIEDFGSQPPLPPGWNPRGYLNNMMHRISLFAG